MATQFSDYEQYNNPIPNQTGDGVPVVKAPVAKPTKATPAPTSHAPAKDDFLSRINAIRPASVAGRDASDVTEYDKNSTLNADVYEQRAQNQPAMEQAVHGVAKGLGLAATTFASTFTALPYGLISATGKIAQGEGVGNAISAIYDNPIAHKFDEFNKYMEQAYPNYYTRDQRNADAFSWTNMGNANFLFDKLIKNAGFTLGAIGSGSIVAKGLQGLGKLAFAGTLAREAAAVGQLEAQGMAYGTALRQATMATRAVGATSQFGATLFAAGGEASMEALETKNNIRESLTAKYAADGKLDTMGRQEIEDAATAGANAVFAANLAILGISDTYQFGKFLGGGWKQEVKALNKMAGEAGQLTAVQASKTTRALRTLGTLASYPASEAWEEGSQFTASTAAKDYHERQYDHKGIAAFQNLLLSTAKGLDQTFGTKEGMESVLLGALTGIGSHVVTGQVADTVLEERNRHVRTVEAAKKLNEYKASDLFKSREKMVVRGQSIQDDMMKSVNDGDVFAFKNLEHDHFKNYVQSRIETGRFDLLIDELNDIKHLPKEEFNQRFGIDPTSSTRKTVSAYVDRLTAQAHTMASTWEDINTRFPGSSEAARIALWDAFTNIENRDLREKELDPEIYTKSGISLKMEKEIDPVNYYKNFAAKVSALVKSDATKIDAEKALDLMKLVEDRQRIAKTYQFLLTEEGQKTVEKKANKAAAAEEARKELVPDATQYETAIGPEMKTQPGQGVVTKPSDVLKAAIADIKATNPGIKNAGMMEKLIEAKASLTDPEQIKAFETHIAKLEAAIKPKAVSNQQQLQNAIDGIYAKEPNATDAEVAEILEMYLPQIEQSGNMELANLVAAKIAELTTLKPGGGNAPGAAMDTVENYKQQLMAQIDHIAPDSTWQEKIEVVENYKSTPGLNKNQLEALDQAKAYYEEQIKKEAAEAAKKAGKPDVTLTQDELETLNNSGDGHAPIVEEDISGDEEPALAGTLMRTTSDIKTDSPMVKRHQMFLQESIEKGDKYMVVTMNTDPELYAAIMNTPQRKWDPTLEKSKKFGILLLMVDKNNNIIVADDNGKRVDTTDRQTILNSYDGEHLGSGEVGIMTAAIPNNKVSGRGNDLISAMHFAYRNLGIAREDFFFADQEMINQAILGHEKAVRAVKEGLMTLPLGTVVTYDITTIGYGVENTKAFDPITIEELLGVELNDDSVKFIIPTAGKRKGKTTLTGGDIPGLIGRHEVTTGRPYMIHNGRLYPLQARTMKQEESELVAALFTALVTGKESSRDNIMQAIRSYIFMGENMKDESKRIFVKDGKVYFGEIGKVALKDAAKSVELITFLNSKYRQVDAERLNKNIKFKPVVSVGKDGFIVYGEKTSYREWMMNESKGMYVTGVSLKRRNEGVPRYLNSYAELSDNGTAQDSIDLSAAEVTTSDEVEELPEEQPEKDLGLNVGVRPSGTEHYTEFSVEELQHLENVSEDVVGLPSKPSKGYSKYYMVAFEGDKRVVKRTFGKKVIIPGYEEYNFFVRKTGNQYVVVETTSGTTVGLASSTIKGATEDAIETLTRTGKERMVKAIAQNPSLLSVSGFETKTAQTPAPEEAPTTKRRTIKKVDTGDKFVDPFAEDSNDSVKKRMEALRSTNELEDFKELKAWFERVFGETFSVVGSKLRGDAMGTYSKFGVKLWKLAEKGTGYHEAFHKVRAEYLSDAEWAAMVQEYKDRVPGSDDLSDDEIEERIAEDFRTYVLSGATKVLGGRARRNTIFRRLYNFLGRMFTGNRTIEDVYEQLYYGTFKNEQKKESRQLANLKRVIPGLNEGQTKEIVDSVNSYFFQILFKNGMTPLEIMDSSKGRDLVVSDIYNDVYKALMNNYNNIEETHGHLDDEEFNSVVDQYEFIRDNWMRPVPGAREDQYSNVVLAHKDFLRGLGIDLTVDFDAQEGIKVSEEGAEEAVSGQGDELGKSADDNISREVNGLKAANEMNPMEFNSTAVRLLIASLFKKQMVNGVAYNVTNRLGVPELVEFKKVYAGLLKHLAGCSTYEDMYTSIEKLANEDPTYKALLTRLGSPENVNLTDEQMMFQNQFRQDFSKFESRGVITLIDPKTGVYYDEDANSNRLVKKIIDKWRNNMRSMVGSGYITTNDEGLVVVDAARKINGKTLTELDDVNLLRELGITFSEYTDAELANELSGQTMDFIRETIDELVEKDLPVTDLFSKEMDLAGRMNGLAALEAQNSKETVELSYISAEGKTIYAITLNNYYSLIVNGLNNANHWSEIQAKYPYLDTIYAQNSLWIDAMYPRDPKTKQRGARVKSVRLRMDTMSGMKNQNDVSSGIAATKMTTGDKVAQEITSMLLYGRVSLKRAGDKATEYAFVLESADGKGVYKDANDVPGHLAIPIDSVAQTFNTEEMAKAFLGYFWSEMGRIKRFRAGKGGSGKDIQIYATPKKDENGKTIPNSAPAANWSIFGDMFKGKTAAALEKYITPFVDAETNNVSFEEIPEDGSVEAMVMEAVASYFEQYAKEITEEMLPELRIGEYIEDMDAYTGITKSLTHRKEGDKWIPARSVPAVVRAFVANHMIQTIEQHKLLIGDQAFYKDNFKRISGGTGTKKTARVSDNMNNWLNKNWNREDKKVADGRVNVSIFADHKAVSSLFDQYIADMEEFYESIGRPKDSEELKAIMKSYAEMDEGDAQGWITLDEYREFFMRAGEWTAKHEKQYQYEILSEAERAEVEDPGFVFQPIKAQYFGPQVYAGLNAITFHKYSLMPLFDRNTKGTNMSKLLHDMRNRQVGYALFGSGVKVGAKLAADGKLAPFYDAPAGEYGDITGIPIAVPIQQIYYEYLGIQLDIAPKTKDQVIFGSQFRKLFLSNMFGQFPVDYSGTKDEWQNLTEGEKIEASPFYAIAANFLETEKELIDRAFESLTKELGIVRDEKGIFRQVDVTALVDALRQSAIDRDMADNLVDSIQTVERNGKIELLYPIDSLVNRPKIENMLFALVNSRVVKQKMNGEGMIQGASSGFEQIGQRKIGASNELKFYSKGKDGTNRMECKVPATGQYEKLSRRFGGVDGLNKAIKEDRANRETEGYKPKVDPRLLQMIGYRIPTQGMNSIDVLEIVEFLPHANGSLIILPTEIVAKSGGDFDIDKLNVFRPVVKYNQHRHSTTYVEYADGTDAMAMYNAYMSHKKDFVGTPIGDVVKAIQDLYKDTIEKAKAEAMVDYVKSIKKYEKESRKEHKLSEEEEHILDRYKSAYYTEREELTGDLEDADNETERMEVQERLDALDESFRQQAAQLQGAAQQYMLKQLENKNVEAWKQIKVVGKQQTDNMKEEIGNALIQAVKDGVVTISQINSDSALQNRILELAQKSILDKRNYTYLITPNTTDTLTGLVAEIRKARGEEKKGANTHTQELRFDVIMDQFKYFLGGKGGVGVGAVHVTHHTLAQVADVHLNEAYAKAGGDTVAINIPFKHNTREYTKTLNLSGGVQKHTATVVSLSGLYDTAGNLISDILSQFINAYVDVAKDPFYKVLNAGTDAAGVYFYLVRAGVDIKTVAYFMTQPIIVDLIAAEENNKALFLDVAGLSIKAKINSEDDYEYLDNKRAEAKIAYQEAQAKGKKTKKLFAEWQAAELAVKNIYDEVREKYAKVARPDLKNKAARHYYSSADRNWTMPGVNDKLLGMIKKGAQPVDSWSVDFANSQLTVLDQFLELRKQAGMLTDFMRSLNQDTALLKNFGSVMSKEMLVEKVRTDSFIPMVKRSDVLKKTIVGAFDRMQDVKEMYRDLLFTLQEPAQFMNDVMRRINPPSSEFDKVYETLSNDLIGYIIQAHGRTAEGKPLHTIAQGLFNGPNSLARRLAKMRAAGKLVGNPLIDELQSQLNENTKSVDNIKLYTRRMTTFEANRLTGAFRELLESKDAEVRTFGKDLVHLGILQSGLHQSPISFTNLIPYDEYGDMVKDAINRSKIEGINWAHFRKAFYFKNKGNKTIVPYESVKKEVQNRSKDYIQRFNGPGVETTMLENTGAQSKEDRGMWLSQTGVDSTGQFRIASVPAELAVNFGYRLQWYGLSKIDVAAPVTKDPIEAHDEVSDNDRNDSDENNDDYDNYSDQLGGSFGDEAGELGANEGYTPDVPDAPTLNFSAMGEMKRRAIEQWNELMEIKRNLVSLGHIQITCRI